MVSCILYLSAALLAGVCSHDGYERQYEAERDYEEEFQAEEDKERLLKLATGSLEGGSQQDTFAVRHSTPDRIRAAITQTRNKQFDATGGDHEKLWDVDWDDEGSNFEAHADHGAAESLSIGSRVWSFLISNGGSDDADKDVVDEDMIYTVADDLGDRLSQTEDYRFSYLEEDVNEEGCGVLKENEDCEAEERTDLDSVANDEDALPLSWNDESYEPTGNGNFFALELVYAVVDLGSKVIEFSAENLYVYHAVVAVVVVLWLVNALLFVGLWRVPKLHSTMRIQPSLDDKSRGPSTDRSASDSRWSRSRPKRRRRSHVRQDPQQTDSTIATVTLFISGGGAGEGVKIVKNAAAADIAVDCPAAADIAVDCADVAVGPDSLMPKDFHESRKPRRRHVQMPIDTYSVFPNVDRARRKSNERHSPPKPCRTDDAPLAVYDLEDHANLPAEILDILSCQGGVLCFHDHDRFCVANNKVYVYKKHNPFSRHRSKKNASPLYKSPRRHSRSKKVTFSPVNKRQSPNKGRNSRRHSVSPRLRQNSSAGRSVPPPPSGYHIRIDPSTQDSYNENSASDDSTWSQNDKGEASELTYKSRLESVELTDTSPLKKQHPPLKMVKKHSVRAPVATPRRFARSSKCKTKKHRFDSDQLSSIGNYARRRQNHPENKHGISGCGAFGDTVWKEVISEPCHFGFLGRNFDNIGEPSQVEVMHGSDHNEGLYSNFAVNSKIMRADLNNNSLIRTVCRGNYTNINNNNLNLAMPSEQSQVDVSAGSAYILHLRASDVSYVFQTHDLNVNTNAFPNNDSIHEDMPGEQQEAIVEQNPSSTTPSFDQFYTPETASPGGPPELTSEAAPGDCELCLEKVTPDLEMHLLQVPYNMEDKSQTQEVHAKSEQECWESKKQSIMMACNEAIKNRLQRQEIEEEESREITSSESTSVNHSSGKKKRRKTKTTESVIVKFKTSLSKKMTTTTTLREVKQSSQGVSGKTMMLENDHQNVLSLTSKSSEQSLSVPQPRHTRIVKCGETESQIRKRKLSSDTEVELMHSTESNKQPSGVSREAKDGFVRDRQINKKENTYGETPMVEVHYMDVDRQDISQRSPHQNLSIGHGEMTGECDKLSDKASAITVINVLDKLEAASKIGEMQSHKKPKHENQELSQEEKPVDTANHSLVCPSESVKLEVTTSKERVKKKSKSSKQREKRKSEHKRAASRTKETLEAHTIGEALQGPQSETSLSQTSKKLISAPSPSKTTRLVARSHSSPPDGRKKRSVSKKKGSVHLLEPSEADSKKSHKARKISPDKKRKLKISVLKEGKPKKTGSTSSTISVKKRKSQTTASSISTDSEEDGQHVMEKVAPEIEVTLPAVEVESFEPPLNIEENTETLVGHTEVLNETVSKEEICQKINAQNSIGQSFEVTSVQHHEICEEKVDENGLQPNENSISKPKMGVPKLAEEIVNGSKVLNKISNKASTTRASKNQSKVKDFQKAEEGWNNSIFFYTEGKNKAAEAKPRGVTRRPKLKYVLVKAKDKTKIQKSSKTREVLNQQVESEVKSPCEAVSDHSSKQDGHGDSSMRGQAKTVQFSESIEKMENTKQADILEEVESMEDQAQENHIGDNASDGSLGDMFLSNNFDLVRELVEEEEEDKQEQLESEPKPEVVTPPEKQKKRNRRPMWLKKAAAKPPEDPVMVETRVVVSKQQNLSPKRSLEKKKESFEEVILKPNKCNIEVTNPLPPTGICPKEVAGAKAKVAYSSMLSNVIFSLPLKRGAKRVIAETGSPVDIKEVIEGSSVDATDYAKNLRYSPKSKRLSTVVSAGTGRKKGFVESRARSPKEMPVRSGSARSLLSRDSDADHGLTTANCSFSTDLDEASVNKPVQLRAARKKETHSASGHRASYVLPWRLMDGAWSHVNEQRSMRVVGDMNILSMGLSWLIQEFFRRFDFLNPRRHVRSTSYRQARELSLDPPAPEQQQYEQQVLGTAAV
ncbi:Mlck protein [Elysia marginata]|uniref:Mlck protein n=1 Tax=Elysia marginata TaxID=1093978 RepID=A0AAV4GKK0_9GAST|nr:Mlck protein [Elysia marginata]